MRHISSYSLCRRVELQRSFSYKLFLSYSWSGLDTHHKRSVAYRSLRALSLVMVVLSVQLVARRHLARAIAIWLIWRRANKKNPFSFRSHLQCVFFPHVRTVNFIIFHTETDVHLLIVCAFVLDAWAFRNFVYTTLSLGWNFKYPILTAPLVFAAVRISTATFERHFITNSNKNIGEKNQSIHSVT